MPVEVILPKVDMDMSHGKLATWHVAEGETVAKGAPLFDIETDKAAMEVESPASGRLLSVTAQPGDMVAVGTVVALIYAEGETVAETPIQTTAAPEPEAPVAKTVEPVPTATAHPAAIPQADPAVAPGLRATPAARAAARASGITLEEVPGTGPRGRIQRDDVAAFLAHRVEAPALASPGAGAWSAQPGPLHVSSRKGTGVPLVLIHGFTADSQSWAPLEKALGADRPLIRIDLPGHGRSPRRRLGSFAELARMVVEALDDVTRGHDKVDLLGHSLGGALALAAADIRARRIRSLALIAPAGLGPEIDAQALTGITRATRAESLAPWLRRLTATPDGISDDYARAAMRLRADPALRAFQAELAEILFPDGVQPFDLRPALSRLEIPTAILWGRSDHILPWRQALSITGDFALHLLADAGHVPQLECPDRVARILVRHLLM
ncbi:acetoin dehydrogenase dihydrolipoyllysine-residue acetyltransferase subunit [Tabrizicola sp. TH137]|uniref:acetoin dehydrogenase dihydrolipoyllysine-residue acetyltransferase subunit n=1 Tax=Tabrizicola sp. TH137 TaxID=2067452 RepID=UPI000C7B9EF1|nr:acetoin dehydrogenase dihydrolipoyllysine-residue acetyltransferase subunit [Tabrizicola sp. TH137]PLL10627.1 acetoin dehydrogenase dihydrolipoyllysine-residue acetyltransferase subunit [Tabrizicola sp. TH137]